MVCYRNERRTEDNICVQICILYYILLYEDVRLANMRNILASGRQVSPKLLVVRLDVVFRIRDPVLFYPLDPG
jgi:hypothetical protein